jgi:streptogramin lyase
LAKGNRVVLILLMALSVASIRLPLQAQTTGVIGVVKNAGGAPLAGALVKVKSESSGLGFMVVSQVGGQFKTPNLLPGKYSIRGFGGDSQSETTQTVEVALGQRQKVDLTLSSPLKIPLRQKRMTNDDYTNLLPEGPAKRVVAGKCSFCHSLLEVVSARKTPEKWKETYDRMYDDLQGMRKPIVAQSNEDQENDVVLDYLTKNFTPSTPQYPEAVGQWFLRAGGPSHPDRNLPTTLLKGPAAKYVAMVYALPPGALPHDIAVDSQGIAWVTERTTGMLGRFDPNSLTYTRTATPAGKTSKFQLDAVAVGPDDQVWFADDGPNARMIRFDPKSKEFTNYPIPEYQFPVPDSGWARIGTLRFLDGNVWATGVTSQRILKLDPKARKFLTYSVPRGSEPYGLAVGGDKLIWYAGTISNVVARLDISSGRLTRHDVGQLPLLRAALRGLAADAQGNLWGAANESGKLAKVDFHTGNVTEYEIPTVESGPFSVDVDKTRNLIWFSEIHADRIGRFDPASGTFVEFPHPLADSDVRRIEIDPHRPNRVWWASTLGNSIGYIEVIE